MVRSDGWKLIARERTSECRFAGHGLAVFELETDPYEYVNLVDTPAGQEVLTWAIAKHEELAQLAASGRLDRGARAIA